MDRRSIILLAISHLGNDLNQGAIPALLPFLVVERNLSYVAASGIVLAATVISSFLQPTLGYYSDRRPIPWLMPLGALVGGLGLALAGVAPTYWLIIATVLCSGAGVAAFHPESYRFANYVSGRQRASGMSIFTVGGVAGFALGPMLVNAVVLPFGLAGTLLLALPAFVVTLVLMRELPRLAAFRPAAGAQHTSATSPPDRWRAFLRLVAMIVLYAAFSFGLLTFVPLYLITVRGMAIAQAKMAITVMSIAGASGSLMIGYLADRFGRKRLLVAALAIMAPLTWLFMLTNSWWGFVYLAVIGALGSASFTIAVVMGQEYMAKSIGVASGITTGLAIGLGGASAPLFGLMADQFGVTAVLYSLAVLPLIATGLSLTLPPAGVSPQQTSPEETALPASGTSTLRYASGEATQDACAGKSS
jgi:FSR family fosmidomycin resistance protein-like MFS transporter